VAKLFFLLSGENPTLPFSEVTSILEAEGYRYKILQRLTQVLRLESRIESSLAVKFRASMTRSCGLELFICKANINEIIRNVETSELNHLIKEGESFVVRIKRVRESTPEIGRWRLEQKIGEIIFNKIRNVKVNLKNPQKTFLGILTDNSFIFGLELTRIKPKPFVERRPRRRAFFHPTAMQAKLARCMVNLAQPRKGELVLDPFCGTGSFLIEAGLIGCRVLGFDMDRRMAEGSLRNLSHYGLKAEGVGVADARHLPIVDSTVDCVVTDPPYGISATTFGLRIMDLVESFLLNIIDKIKRQRRICLAAPKSLKIGELGEKLGFKHVESHFVYVHRSLTREIAVLMRD